MTKMNFITVGVLRDDHEKLRLMALQDRISMQKWLKDVIEYEWKARKMDGKMSDYFEARKNLKKPDGEFLKGENE